MTDPSLQRTARIAGVLYLIVIVCTGFAEGYVRTGLLLTLAAAGYLIESFGTFLLPRYEAVYVWGVAVPAAVAEVSLALWLALKGIRTDRRTDRRPAGASTGIVGR